MADTTGTTDTTKITESREQGPSFFDMLNMATQDNEHRVHIPEEISKFLAAQLGYFSANNRNKRTMVIENDALARGILVNRTVASVTRGEKSTTVKVANLTGPELWEAAAKEFAAMVRQYAADHKLSPVATRDGRTIVFRLAAKRD